MSWDTSPGPPPGTPPSSGSLGPQPGRLGRGAEGWPSPHTDGIAPRRQGPLGPAPALVGMELICKAAPGRPLTPPLLRPQHQELADQSPRRAFGKVGPARPPKARSWEGAVPCPTAEKAQGQAAFVPEAEGHLAGRPECSGSSGKAPAQDHRESRASSSPEKPAGQGRSGQARDTSVLRLPDFLPGPVAHRAHPGRLSSHEAAVSRGLSRPRLRSRHTAASAGRGRQSSAVWGSARPPVSVAPGPLL